VVRASKLKREGRKEDYMYALTKPHGSCRGSSGSDMHKQKSKPKQRHKTPNNIM
jgi:hypothetical protein